MEEQLINMWNYYLTLEQDLSNTSKYVEPSSQETVFSFEFAKIIILANTEVETTFKSICKHITGEEKGSIADYKDVILKKYPLIVTAETTISRYGKTIKPFEGWDKGKLPWWDAYQHIKHGRGSHFSEANYINAAYSLAALYILILYLSKITNVKVEIHESSYISSKYCPPFLLCAPSKQLPDFETADYNTRVIGTKDTIK